MNSVSSPDIYIQLLADIGPESGDSIRVTITQVHQSYCSRRHIDEDDAKAKLLASIHQLLTSPLMSQRTAIENIWPNVIATWHDGWVVITRRRVLFDGFSASYKDTDRPDCIMLVNRFFDELIDMAIDNDATLAGLVSQCYAMPSHDLDQRLMYYYAVRHVNDLHKKLYTSSGLTVISAAILVMLTIYVVNRYGNFWSASPIAQVIDLVAAALTIAGLIGLIVYGHKSAQANKRANQLKRTIRAEAMNNG